MGAGELTVVRERIASAAAGAGRDPADVRLVVVTKGRTVAQVRELYAAGHREFGENRAQEFTEKAPQLPEDIDWHFVGPLQRNKVNKVRGCYLHSLDRERLANAWVGEPALVQVNIGSEPQKHGVAPAEAVGFALRCVEIGVAVEGLMAIAPRVAHPEEARPYFARLRELRDELVATVPAAGELSMGMTEDFEVAVAEGATMVRVGRAIFEAAGEGPQGP